MSQEQVEEDVHWTHPVVQTFMGKIDSALMHSRAVHQGDNSIPVPAAAQAIKNAQLVHLDDVYNEVKVGLDEDGLKEAKIYYEYAKECIEHNMAPSVVPFAIYVTD